MLECTHDDAAGHGLDSGIFLWVGDLRWDCRQWFVGERFSGSAFLAALFWQQFSPPQPSHGFAVRTSCSSNFCQLVLVHDVVVRVPSRLSPAKTTNLFKLLDLRSRMAILEASAEQRPGENPEDPAEQANSELLKTTTDSCNLCTDRQWFFSCAHG